MRRLFVAVLACGMLGACTQNTTAPSAEELVARGEYLVTAIGGCNDCHTPMTAEGPDMAQSLQGAELIFTATIPIPWAPYAPPLAGIPEHFTEVQFTAFLQSGVRPDGTTPLPPMPPYRFTEADARAVTAYIASLPAAE